MYYPNVILELNVWKTILAPPNIATALADNNFCDHNK